MVALGAASCPHAKLWLRMGVTTAVCMADAQVATDFASRGTERELVSPGSTTRRSASWWGAADVDVGTRLLIAGIV